MTLQIYFSELKNGRESADELMSKMINGVWGTHIRNGEFEFIMISPTTIREMSIALKIVKPYLK